jgi:hypothetical protein
VAKPLNKGRLPGPDLNVSFDRVFKPLHAGSGLEEAPVAEHTRKFIITVLRSILAIPAAALGDGDV